MRAIDAFQFWNDLTAVRMAKILSAWVCSEMAASGTDSPLRIPRQTLHTQQRAIAWEAKKPHQFGRLNAVAARKTTIPHGKARDQPRDV